MNPTPFRQSLESDLHNAIAKNLQLKSKILGIIFTVLFTLLGIAFLLNVFFNIEISKIITFEYIIYILAVILIFAMSEWGAYFFLKKHKGGTEHIRGLFAYAINFIEASFPTIALIGLQTAMEDAGYAGTTLFLDGPPVFAYFFFIILSSLQMDFRICLAVGLFIALQHFFLCWYYVSPQELPEIMPIDIRLPRSVLFLVGGVIAGMVSQKIKESVLVSLKAKNDLIFNLDGLVQQRTREVVEQKNHIQEQNDLLEEKNKNISDSINYAQRIQRAILPPESRIRTSLPLSFILFKPKDIVSGDFYFVEKVENQVVFSAVDCTGHGVPGSLMSVMGFKYIEQAVAEKGILNPSEILFFLDKGINHSLRQSSHNQEVKDGMDLAICSFNSLTLQLECAGAYNNVIIIRNGDLTEFKGDHWPIGELQKKYSIHSMKLQKNDLVYMTTDGYEDQFGGPKGKKFKAKCFKELLLSIYQKPMEEQKIILDTTIETWKNSREQTDDICVMGVRI